MSSEQSGRPGPSRTTVVRDSLGIVGGWYLIIYQAQFAPTFNWVVFASGLVAAGLPGAVQVWAARPGGAGITGPSSPEPAPEQSSSGPLPPG